MKILALLNRDGGSLKTTDLGQLTTLMQDEFRMHGHELTVDDCSGDEIVAAIGKAAEREDIDLVVMGAYGHSRIRSFLIGSTTSEIVRGCYRPVLLFR